MIIYRTFIIALFLVFAYGCSDSNNNDSTLIGTLNKPGVPSKAEGHPSGLVAPVDSSDSDTKWGWHNSSTYVIEVTVSDSGNPSVGTSLQPGDQILGITGSSWTLELKDANDKTLYTAEVATYTDCAGCPYLYDTQWILTFSYDDAASKKIDNSSSVQDITASLAPPVISNEGWTTSGMGNVSAAATEGESFWGIDYGFEEGRWTYGEGAAYQTNKAIAYDGGTNYGSRAFPVALGNDYVADYGPGSGYDGLWQIDIQIGSDGESNNSFCETFYLSERYSPNVGVQYYSDGSPAGNAAGLQPWSQEIDIMETTWNAGKTKVGPQMNLPEGGESEGGPFTGWTTDTTYQNYVAGEWSDIGGVPAAGFATYGILIRGDSLWIYAYKPDGTFWYSTPEIKRDSPYTPTSPFVPYIGTWHGEVLGTDTINTVFQTGYKNFIYLAEDDASIDGLNPFDNSEQFGQVLVSPQQAELEEPIVGGSQCVNMSKCNMNHSGKQCCTNGIPVGSCEASYSQDCDTTCLLEGGTFDDCTDQCTTASCEAY
jgi:hypothetical protein